MYRAAFSSLIASASIAPIALLWLAIDPCFGQPTRVEINQYKNACWEKRVPTDLIARFGKNYRDLALDGIDVRAFSIQGVHFPTNLQDADFSRANLNKAIFSGAALDGGNFTQAKLNGASVSTCSMQ
jgi:uncharacterized protein YjbI with pentapeptide repeats